MNIYLIIEHNFADGSYKIIGHAELFNEAQSVFNDAIHEAKRRETITILMISCPLLGISV